MLEVTDPAMITSLTELYPKGRSNEDLEVALTPINVTARYLRADGTPAAGRVEFTLSHALQDVNGDVIATPTTVIATVGEDGRIAATLFATDGEGLQPVGVTYVVIERLDGGMRKYNITLPSTSNTVDLADLAPAQDQPVYQYALADHTHENEGGDGASAYEVAVASGFIGTEAEWLASLEGPVGPQGDIGLTGAQGDQGPIGPEGPQGEVGPVGPEGEQGLPGDDGESAYEVAVANGFVGTEADWLASLVGPEGPEGPPGVDGSDADATAAIAAHNTDDTAHPDIRQAVDNATSGAAPAVIMPLVGGFLAVASNSYSNQSQPFDRWKISPIYVPGDYEWDGLAVNVTTAAAAGATGGLAIWSSKDSPGRAGNVLASGSVAIDSTGQKTFVFSAPLALDGGVYWLGFRPSAAVTVTSYSVNADLGMRPDVNINNYTHIRDLTNVAAVDNPSNGDLQTGQATLIGLRRSA